MSAATALRRWPRKWLLDKRRWMPSAGQRLLIVAGIVALILVALVWGPRLAHRERALVDDEIRATRLIAYALAPGGSLRVPLPSGTEVIRVVAHVFRHGPLAPGVHRTRWRIGSHGPLEMTAPGATGRAFAEESGLVIGDPVAFNIDARDSSDELSLVLDSAAGAEGVLVRIYRRESLLASEERLREDAISPSKRARLAVRAGELSWIDLPTADRATLLGARWRKVAPLPSEQQPFHAVALSLSYDFAAAAGPVTSPSHAAAGAGQSQLSAVVDCERILPGRPAIVHALDEPIVLRVQARRPFPNADLPSITLHMAVDVSSDARALTAQFEAQLVKATADRYDTTGEARLPSERATFYVLIPRSGEAVIRVAEGEADLVLAELDPRSVERRFVRRRPSNWSVFTAGGTVRLQSALEGSVVAEQIVSASPILHVPFPLVVGWQKHEGRTFVPTSASIPFEMPEGRASRLFLRLLTDVPADVQVVIDGGQPRRRLAGLATSITAGRIVHADGETKLSLVLGDDLEPGRHVLSFQPNRATCSVHLPWQRRARAPRETAWIVGDFQP